MRWKRLPRAQIWERAHKADTRFPAVNYEDPNLNVGIPVFSIHGNHDDPQGTGPVSSFGDMTCTVRREGNWSEDDSQRPCLLAGKVTCTASGDSLALKWTRPVTSRHADVQEGALCALDVLSVAGVLNYFGKIDLGSDETNEGKKKGIDIRPILLRKGSTNLALYGVGNVKDTRFHYELRSNGVKMFMPKDGDVAADDWFNLLLIHQNR